MRKIVGKVLLTGALVLSMCSTALAGTWQQEGNRWWWEESDQTYPVSSWKWIDGNQDGVAECYYFDENGYLLVSTTTPDGYQVDESGQWLIDGVIQQQIQNTESETPIEPTQRYTNALNKTNNLDSIDASINMTMDMAMRGISINTTMDMTMKVKDANTSNIKFFGDFKMDLLGESVKATYFFTDGYFYVDMEGEKIKIPVALADTGAGTTENTGDLMTNLQFVKDLQMTEDEQGNYIFAFNCEPEVLNSQLMQIEKSMNYGQTTSQTKVRECSGRSVVNADGYVTLLNLILRYDSTMGEETVSYDMNIGINFNNPGQSVDFTIPSTAGYKLFY